MYLINVCLQLICVKYLLCENRFIIVMIVFVQGTPDRLMSQLVEVENYIDPTYVEDFLLTHRTFLSSPLVVADKLLLW